MAGDYAAPEPSNGQRSFDIPSQELSTALSEYSAATGISILVDGSLSTGRMSASVKGVFSPAAALQSLLDRTGLTVRYATPTALALVPASPTPGRAVDLVRESYFAAIQAAVVRVLCKHAGTRPGQYRSVVRLWIDRSGIVQRSEILASTKAIEAPAGDNGREERASVIIVEFLGFGGAPEGEDTPNRRPCDAGCDPAVGPRTQNPLSSVQVVGAGSLSPNETQLLTEEERSKIQ
ncbi:MAG: STN domain-containing protein [Bradyrhizobium sp.]|uniref:STN domain-containing protein n=1 Tax=Bradyrhizobium sp. TaxID=376 RepID=UPI001D2483A2|nr:STN domain-containing protein [Bradyrhizobium sp.]MBV9561922.1 STN domain-containing protein [Bradyrhizobium sp.]